jgi:ABC-type sulfate transport system permease component
MRKSLRVASTVMVFLGTWALCSIVLLLLPLGVFGIIGSLAALVVAYYAARRVWRAFEHGPDSAVGTAVTGVVLGAIGGYLYGRARAGRSER